MGHSGDTADSLHVSKGKTIAQTLADRTGYSKNEEKTEGGKYISSYECDARTADEEFLLSKRQYEQITGRRHEHNVIAYQICQSFKPGELALEEANYYGTITPPCIFPSSRYSMIGPGFSKGQIGCSCQRIRFSQ